MEIIFLIIGILIGGVLGSLLSKLISPKGLSTAEANELSNQINLLKIENSKLSERNNLLEENLSKTNSELNSERTKVIDLNSSLSSLKADYSNLQKKLDEEKKEIETLQEKFKTEFKNIANEILEDKSKKFTELNKINIGEILNPLNEKIKDFQKKVEDTHLNDSKERASLSQQIKMLHELNQQMTKEANNLTNALKGESQTMGSWGEFILESILEKSGLEKNREYLIQETLTSSDGKKLRPDVIIKLPDNKNIIIDSKVSLIDYETYISSDDEKEKSIALTNHIRSVKNHIKELSVKNYQNLYQINSLDFVLMFIPVEPAFSLAIKTEQGLFDEAFEKNIVIVCPSTLLATLRTIANIWRYEKQNRNALEIAQLSGSLYDKFFNLIENLKDIQNRFILIQNSFDDTFKKLSSGRGNIIFTIEKIRKLGAKATKSLSPNLIEQAETTNLKLIENDDENLLDDNNT